MSRRQVWAVLVLVVVAVAAVFILPRALSPPRVLARGVSYQLATLSGPVRVHIVTFDRNLSDAGMRLFSGGDTLDELASLPAMVERAEVAGATVLAAVNGGLFDKDGTPIGLFVTGGTMLRGAVGRPVLTVNEEGAPFITGLEYGLTYASHQFPVGVPVDRYNRSGAGNVCVYSDAYPFDIPLATGSLVVEVSGVLRHGLHPDRTTFGRVVSMTNIPAATSIAPASGRLLVRLSGEVAQRLVHFHNQPVAFHPAVEGDRWGGQVVTAVGGSDSLLLEGKASPALRAAARMGGNTERHPRTAVGYSKNHEKMYLVVVEGRHPGSRGMTLLELAEYMEKLNAWSAINLDGGGSSGMWLAGHGIVTPDAQRELNNALAIVMKSPRSATGERRP